MTARTISRTGHQWVGTQKQNAGAGTDTATTKRFSTPITGASLPPNPQTGSAEHSQPPSDTQPLYAVLADPTLALLADVLDDLERTRIANENRLRQLTRDEADSDGEHRGFGLTLDHPAVARLAGIVDGISKLEHEAVLNLNRAVRNHPLYGWASRQRGVAKTQPKAFARLLAAIGDPYWNTLHDRPRTVSELWAYCGLHTLPASQSVRDAHTPLAGGVNVAARRRKGELANWSNDAKQRAWLIANSLVRAGVRNGEAITPWGEVYKNRKAATTGRVHAAECRRCGPSGKPAQPGSPWSDAHRHTDALRITAKHLLKELWREARRIHQEGGQS